MRKFIYLLICLTRIAMNAQDSADKTVYMDSTGRVTNESNYDIRRTIKDYYSERDIYEINYYYKSGKLQSTGQVNKKEPLSYTGEFIFYYENGNKKRVNSFENSSCTGLYKEWYENGNKKIESEYLKGDKIPKGGSYKIHNAWNEKNEQTVIQGNGDFAITEENKAIGKTHTSGKLKNGYKDGIWTGNNFKLGFTFTETYREGEFVSGTSVDAKQQKHEYEKITVSAKPKDGMDDFYKFIRKKLKIPRSEGNLQGKIYVTFTVNPDGSVVNANIIRGLKKSIDDEAIRIVQSYTDWNGGKTRGIETPMLLSLPITISGPN